MPCKYYSRMSDISHLNTKVRVRICDINLEQPIDL